MCVISNLKDLKKLINTFQNIFIYGTGEAGKYVLKIFVEIGLTQKLGFIVTKRKIKESHSYFGLPLFSIDELARQTIREYLIVIPPSSFKDELVDNCKIYNFKYVTVPLNFQELSGLAKDNIKSEFFKPISEKCVESTALEKISCDINRIIKKLSMVDNIWRLGNVLFYVPNYPGDFIQSFIVDNNEFFEQDTLSALEPYICDNANILDLGANIGNHTIYFASHCNVSHIYSFEPVKSTFKILKKNIEINKFHNVTIFNLGASYKNENAVFEIYDNLNIGNSHLFGLEDNLSQKNNQIKLVKMDDFLSDKLERLDFIKIDVEDYEYKALLGLRRLLCDFSPLVFIEIYPEFYLKDNSLLESYGYRQIRKFPHHNYLYQKI